MSAISGKLAAAGLTGLAGVHLAWGLGSPFPFATRDELADAVIGQTDVPPPAACFAVTGALLLAAGLAADVPVGPPPLRRIGRLGVAGVLGLRGGLGLLASTNLVSPGSTSDRFRHLDRTLYAPLCLALAAATASGSPR